MARVALSGTGAEREGTEHPGGHPSLGVSTTHTPSSRGGGRETHNPHHPISQGSPCPSDRRPLLLRSRGRAKPSGFVCLLQGKLAAPLVTDTSLKNAKRPQPLQSRPAEQGTEPLLFQVHPANLKWLPVLSGSRLCGFLNAGRWQTHCSHPDGFKSTAGSQGSHADTSWASARHPEPARGGTGAGLGTQRTRWERPGFSCVSWAGAGRGISMPARAILPRCRRAKQPAGLG